jgi:hypothetical protein
MKLRHVITATFAAALFSANAFGAAYLCANGQAKNADESNWNTLGTAKCLETGSFTRANVLAGTAIVTKDGQDAATAFTDSSTMMRRIGNAQLVIATSWKNGAAKGRSIGPGQFLLMTHDNSKCLGTNLSGALPKVASIGLTNCWIFEVSLSN